MEVSSFLRWVWTRSPGKYVFRPHMSPDGVWTEGPALHQWPASRAPEPHGDAYFSVLTFEGRKRLERNVAPGGVLFADLDEVDPRSLHDVPPPSGAWETSPGRFQAIWGLSEPLEAGEHQRWNQALTYHTGADRGGWGLTKVLRVPGTLNWKRAERLRVPVGRVLWLEPESYELAMFARVRAAAFAPGRPGELAMPALLPKGEWDELLEVLWERLPLSSRHFLTMSATESERMDRSVLIFDQALMMMRAGVSRNRVFQLIGGAPFNKFAERPRQLWRDVCKAGGVLENEAGPLSHAPGGPLYPTTRRLPG